jgi:hypothetical protein
MGTAGLDLRREQSAWRIRICSKGSVWTAQVIPMHQWDRLEPARVSPLHVYVQSRTTMRHIRRVLMGKG